MGAKVTSISDLKSYAGGTIVELPPFAEGQQFFAKLKRPSLLGLLSSGRIPNSLLGVADKLFAGQVGGGQEMGSDNMQQMFELLDLFCEECFAEPTYQELKEAGIQLTDEQIFWVFNYAQVGLKSLEQFREPTGDNSAD